MKNFSYWDISNIILVEKLNHITIKNYVFETDRGPQSSPVRSSP